MADWKDKFMKNAMKAMQNPTVQKVLSSEKAQKTLANAFKASYTFKSQLDEKKEEVARRFNLATSDDLRSMKRELDRLQRQVERLRREKERAEQQQRES
jgi:sensor histidine kinase YesM